MAQSKKNGFIGIHLLKAKKVLQMKEFFPHFCIAAGGDKAL